MQIMMEEKDCNICGTSTQYCCVCLLKIEQRQINERLNRLGIDLASAKSRLENIEHEQHAVMPPNRKPFKCPVCDGTGCDAAIFVLAKHDKCRGCCHACEAKGIVWG